MRARQWTFAAITALLTCALIVTFIGLALRLRPTLFGQQLGNYVFSRYGNSPGDLYFGDAGLGMNLMWPDFETRAYYNGWFWNHRTDERGFRNPPDRAGDVLLLGDSLIYGHGAEMQDGVSEVLNDRYGWSTYNLAQQGDCLYQSYAKTRLYLDDFAPRTVVYFAFLNDASDLEAYRTDQQLDDMTEVSREDWPSLRAGITEQSRHRRHASWIREEPGIRFFGGLFVELKERFRRMSAPAPEAVMSSTLRDPARRARIQRYYDRVLPDLAERVRSRGAELIVVHLDVAAGLDAEDRAAFRELVAQASAEAEVPFFDTGETLIECTDCLLADDGHFNAKGHALLAELVDRWLRELGRDTAPKI
jgi:hypothetical protein